MSELLKKDTKEIQSKLADYCRTGELSLTTEVNQKHVHHYRRLVYNIIECWALISACWTRALRESHVARSVTRGAHGDLIWIPLM